MNGLKVSVFIPRLSFGRVASHEAMAEKALSNPFYKEISSLFNERAWKIGYCKGTLLGGKFDYCRKCTGDAALFC